MKRSDINLELRNATAAVHQRLHQHVGFASAAAGAISLPNYRDLLARLFGFHSSFEILLCEASSNCDLTIDVATRRRAALIEDDLRSLGVDCERIADLPRCLDLPRLATRAQVFGALYVVEGSTLGGRQIARALETMLATTTNDGRRFFLGYGSRHRAMWQEFLEAMARCIETPADAADAVGAARKTFFLFEAWMADWQGALEKRSADKSPSSAVCVGADRFAPSV